MTFFRVSTDDVNGTVKAYVGEGTFESEPLPTKGGLANCHVDGLQKLMRYICQNGLSTMSVLSAAMWLTYSRRPLKTTWE